MPDHFRILGGGLGNSGWDKHGWWLCAGKLETLGCTTLGKRLTSSKLKSLLGDIMVPIAMMDVLFWINSLPGLNLCTFSTPSKSCYFIMITANFCIQSKTVCFTFSSKPILLLSQITAAHSLVPFLPDCSAYSHTQCTCTHTRNLNRQIYIYM